MLLVAAEYGYMLIAKYKHVIYWHREDKRGPCPLGAIGWWGKQGHCPTKGLGNIIRASLVKLKHSEVNRP